MVWTEVGSMAGSTQRERGEPVHVAVLAREVIELARALPPELQTGWVVDGTLGMGGHAERLLEALPALHVLGVDQDEQALELARERLAPFARRLRLRQGRMSELARLVRKERIGLPVLFLFDLGVSSLQLDEGARGFSFQADGPLDMRMDRRRERVASEIVNRWDESDLADLFYYEGGETRARVIARAIVEARERAPFLRTLALADTIARVAGRGASHKVHPATRVFQALRRAVNEEGDELLEGLRAARHWLAPEGRLVVISFHSLEDVEVKRQLVDGAAKGAWSVLTKRPLTPAREELRANPRSRSAKLRAAVRLRAPGDEPADELGESPELGEERA
jgi:16S rRNA (cytosine1402-N4)-methyltransferase